MKKEKMESLKIPYCFEAECAVIKWILFPDGLISNDKVDSIFINLSPADFYITTFDAIYDRWLENHLHFSVNKSGIVCAGSESRKNLQLMFESPRVENIQPYVDIVRERSIMRQLNSLQEQLKNLECTEKTSLKRGNDDTDTN